MPSCPACALLWEGERASGDAARRGGKDTECKCMYVGAQFVTTFNTNPIVSFNLIASGMLPIALLPLACPASISCMHSAPLLCSRACISRPFLSWACLAPISSALRRLPPKSGWSFVAQLV